MSAKDTTTDAKRTARSTMLLPTATSFDLLGGAYLRVRKARMVQLIVIGVGLAALVILGTLAARAWVEEGDLAGEHSAQQAQLAARSTFLSEIANTGSLTREQMTNYLGTRGPELQRVVESDIAVAQVTDSLLASLPAGQELQSLSVKAVEAATDPASSPAGDTSAAGEESAAEPAAPQGPRYTLTIVTVVDGFPALEQWRNVAAALPFLVNAEFTWAGSEAGLTVTTTAGLNPETVTSRATTLVNRLDIRTGRVADELVTSGPPDSSEQAPTGPNVDLGGADDPAPSEQAPTGPDDSVGGAEDPATLMEEGL